MSTSKRLDLSFVPVYPPLTMLREERDWLKNEIGNLAGVIATGRHSPALLAELEKRERRLEEISDELLTTGNQTI